MPEGSDLPDSGDPTGPDAPDDRRRARRGFAAVLLPGVAVAALGAVASSRAWAQLTGASTRLVPAGSPQLAGAGQVPLASALSLLVLAAWGAVLVTRARVRTGFAAIGLLASLALLALAIRGAWSTPDDVRQAVLVELGLSGHRSEAASAIAVAHTGWYWVALVMAVGCVATFALAVPRAHRWPTMSSRYDAPGTRAGAGSAEPPAEPRTNREWWEALDEGRDPTDDGET